MRSRNRGFSLRSGQGGNPVLDANIAPAAKNYVPRRVVNAARPNVIAPRYLKSLQLDRVPNRKNALLHGQYQHFRLNRRQQPEVMERLRPFWDNDKIAALSMAASPITSTLTSGRWRTSASNPRTAAIACRT